MARQGLLDGFEIQAQMFGLHGQLFDSLLSRFERSAAVEAARRETTVPAPTRTSSSPSSTSCVTTLCAVLGLIFNARLNWRTDGKSSPGRSWPDTMAFLAAYTTCS